MKSFEVETLTGACPLCKGNLIGNDFLKYLCKNCMINFSKRDLTEGIFWMQKRTEAFRN